MNYETTLTKFEDLQPGRWYLAMFADLDGTMNPNQAPLVRYEGDGEFTGDGDAGRVEYFVDPVTQYEVPPSAADGYIFQS